MAKKHQMTMIKMATIAFGGGPNLEQRRAFAGLREGTHVPGYRGYCPQIKYRDTMHRHPTTILTALPRETLKNKLPASTGDNKYTEKMVPGYTGYIPRMPFKFGNTYKEDCDVCIDQYLTNRQYHDNKMDDLRRQINGQPRLTATMFDPAVRDKLNLYRDTHPSRPILLEDKKSLTEPPIPGYCGYIPKIKPTELGLGCRYHQSTKNGLETFVQETAANAARNTGTALTRVSHEKLRSAPPGPSSRRLYVPDGMIPKYTGYVPQRRYAFGNTYGDTTRSLKVCAHEKPSFGDLVRHRNIWWILNIERYIY
ncbi:hypothetical protein KUTeg_021930 [Tegillarca granosa]|uniref:Protein FAM166B n=1 Tax=Tegillarca granosa TaxID=220873 RepID=A0ABQ9E4S0_TEGGR|nr:hypothetical protein KUTeg_021930 [Tegillarca granosa]